MANNSTVLSKKRRVLLKMSGEILMGDKTFGISNVMISKFAKEIKKAYDLGVDLAIVIGGGNIFRGISGAMEGIDRVTGDYMGMLATVMNSLALQNAIEKLGIPTRVMTALEMNKVAEPYIKRRAIRHLEKGRILIFAAGTGNPYFTTDTAAALRAIEIGAEILLKGTKVNGLYDKDPAKYSDAKRFKKISYEKVLKDELKVMDMTAISLCRENKLPIRIFNFYEDNLLKEILEGKDKGTIVGNFETELEN